MKKILLILCCILLLTGCNKQTESAQVVATTLPTYEFAKILCDGTDIQVSQLIRENVSCLHDYTLQTSQMRAVEDAQLLILSGAGLEDFMSDVTATADAVLDASKGVAALCTHDEDGHKDHHHEQDPHIWLSPVNAKIMAKNICSGLTNTYPQYKSRFAENLAALETRLDALQAYGEGQLSSLTCRQLITFHDGFSYFADAFDLEILMAVEEESGSEASAAELISIAELVQENNLPAIFTEVSGSTAAADIITRETGVKSYALDMVISGDSYFTGMYRNIDIIKEALG